MRAVVLAAGEGRRLRSCFNRPKPLVRLLGLSLIERNILALRECGITDFVIITGCDAEQIKDRLGNGERYGVKIDYLYNPHWRQGNGLSAHAFTQEYRGDEKFILIMADHIFAPDLLPTFIAAARLIKPDEVLLAADRRLEGVYDCEECTKVKTEGDYALKLGKQLSGYNAVDCGLFIATGALLDALSASIARGAYALTDAVNMLAAARKVKLHFVDGFWIDVDDGASYRYAQKLLLQSLASAEDGLVAKVFNRRISLRITKVLASSAIQPNQISFIAFLTAVAAAICFAAGRPLYGGLLAQLSSIGDGVDGEIARLKYLKSSYGALWDAILDRYADFLIIIALAYSGYQSTANVTVLLVGAVALTGAPLSMLFKEKFHVLSGRSFVPKTQDGIFRYLPANRDGRMLVIMLGGVFNQLPAALIILALVTHFQTLYRLYKARGVM